MKRQLPRVGGIRTLILLCLATLICLPAAGMGQNSASAPTPQAPAVGKYKEAPEFAELVRQAKLPPVEQRLPKNPLVVQVKEVGTYGGELYYPTKSLFEHDIWIREGLVVYKYGSTEIGPGFAERWEVSPDGKEYTFYLREGLKWSDGYPYTADDILFWYNDIMLNKEISPNTPTWISPGGKPGTVSKISDTTVKFTFSVPYPMWLKWLAFNGNFEMEKNCAHYLKPFHTSYGDKAEIEKMMKQGGFKEWRLFFWSKRDRMQTPECPTMAAWNTFTTWPKNDSVLVRNPYYYKVDTAGNQLPYIDRIVAPYVDNSEVARLKAMDGQTDFCIKNMGFSNYTLLKEGEAKGGYRVLKWKTCDTTFALYVNQCVQDPDKRKVFSDKRFRVAVSHSIDRDTISKLVMFGMGVKRQALASPSDAYAIAGAGQKYLEYDPATANRLLDEAGLSKRDANGWRLMPSGKPLEILIETFEFQSGGEGAEVYELVAENMRAVGLNTSMKQIDSSLWYTRAQAGLVDMPGYTCAGMNWDIDPLWFVPVNKLTFWAPLHGLWYLTNGKEGEEPPPEIRQLQLWYDQLSVEPNEKTRVDLGRKIQQAHEDNLWTIGVIAQPFDPLVCNVRLRNVLEEGLSDFRTLYEAQTWPEQLFYVDGKRK